MTIARLFYWPALLSLAALWLNAASAQTLSPNQVQRRVLMKMVEDGNYQEAYEGLRKLSLEPGDDPLRVGDDLKLAIRCLEALGRVDELDEFREAVVSVHSGNWRLLQAAAESYLGDPHHGYFVAGTFYRGDKRGGGKLVNSRDRDRVRALQLMVEATPWAIRDHDRAAVARFYLDFARMWMDNRGFAEAWRLQSLTSLDVLPDYEPGWQGDLAPTLVAPVDAAGKPLFYGEPRAFAVAANDGERWRWCLAQAREYDPSVKNDVLMELADFLQSQYGVQTMAELGWRFGRMEMDDSREEETGVYALATLGEDETIARLATGVKRFKLPEGFNSIAIYQDIAADPRAAGKQATAALARLVSVFENRRQYTKAAEWCRKCIEVWDEADNIEQFRIWHERLDQIVGNWGRFESATVQPAGQGAAVEYRFRNGHRVKCTAHKVKLEALLADVKAYLKSHPGQLDWRRIDIDDLGRRLVEEHETKYLGDEVASWTAEINPRTQHLDKRVTLATPLQTPGAYLLRAEMEKGNTSDIILWVSDTAIVKKPLDGKAYYFVADALTGRPVPNARVEFFGFSQEHLGGRKFAVRTKQFAESSDADGQVILGPDVQPDRYRWIITASTPEGRFAYLGFTGVWYGHYYDAQYNTVKTYVMTDRPVYRPKQKVSYKLWVRRARYDAPENSEFAGLPFTVEVRNPKGDKIAEQPATSDALGGVEGQLELAADAMLGTYQIQLKDAKRGYGGGSFRVEEYKKPEFEVTVEAPAEPVMLGEKITATIRAKYYFGSLVTRATVKYKVTRTPYTEQWYPPGPWDWLYGAGYEWLAYDCAWYPGWKDWGCPRPSPFWWPRRLQNPPEVVAEREVPIGREGAVLVEIDTSLAKAMHSDQDHRYEITAEVVDLSRRTIVGKGEVLAARKPFAVRAWVDRGYYRVGDTVHASVAALRLDGKPVAAKGALSLAKIRYEKGKPLETPVRTWQLATDDQGKAVQKMVASEAGQYRLSCTVTDAKGHSVEGGYLFTVTGAGVNAADFRYNHLEVIPDKQEYRPGDKAKLLVNTDRVGSSVLLFLRPCNGIYLPPKLLRLDGKSTVVEIDVTQKDMPNFFVEAVTIANAKIHTEMKQLVVPPERRVLNVAVEPSSEAYRPATEAKVKLKLTDADGKPAAGSTVVAIYDKALEYISGGSNVPEIRAFFWKWQRSHYPQAETNLARWFYNLVPPNAKSMADLGVFGGSVADESEGAESPETDERPSTARGAAVGGFGGEVGMLRTKGAMSEAVPAAAAPDQANAARAPDEKPALVQPMIRKQFADTALWVGALQTKEDGTAEVSLKMPDNLTAWRIKVWAMGQGTRVGQGETEVITRKDMILRMEAPRFFLETDEVLLTAVVHNYLEKEKRVQVSLETEGKELDVLGALGRGVRIPPGEEKQINWRVRVIGEGEALVRMKALSDEESDAVEQRFPCYVHGMLKTESYSGMLRPDETAGKFAVQVPPDRRPEQSRLEIHYSPTLAGALVDALPYLVGYPYGCTEQTLNRFLPTVIVQKILIEKGVDLAKLKKKHTNLNPQELGDDQKRAEQGKRYEGNPVFDRDEVTRMVKQGVEALGEMQLADGGWGWFSGWGEHSDPHTTATVVHGLQLAQKNDVALASGMLERGVAWLAKYQKEQSLQLQNALDTPRRRPWKLSADDLDAFVYMVLADAGVKDQQMGELLYRDRTKLSVYSLAMFGLALDKQAEPAKLAMVVRNLSQYLIRDAGNQTAWLRLPSGDYRYCWYGSEYEAQAYFLRLLVRLDPKSELAPWVAKYLLANRKHATYWNSTRDTAYCIEALAEFLRASGEDHPQLTVQIWMDSVLRKTVQITPADLFDFDNKYVLEGTLVESGPRQIELRKQGRGPLYYNAYVTNFTTEKLIARAGLDLKVDRTYYRLKQDTVSAIAPGSRGEIVKEQVEKYTRQPLGEFETLRSGDLVEVELVIEAKNDYEYLVFEDMKPAGFEPVDLQSGYRGNELGAYIEFRDNRVVFFVRRLAQGKHSVVYRMRAEVPGQFSALPTRAWAMYAPELKGNSDEIKLQVLE